MERIKRATPLFSLLLICTVFYYQTHFGGLTSAYVENSEDLPFALFLLAGLLSAYFRQSNPFFIAVALALAYAARLDSLPGLTNPENAELTQSALSFLLPLNILFLVLSRERGIFTPIGYAKWALLLLPPTLIKFSSESANETLRVWIETPWHNTILPSLATVSNHFTVWAICILLLVLNSTRREHTLSRAMVGVALAIALGLNTGPLPADIWIFFSTAALILILFLLQNSYKLAFIDQLTGLPGRRALELQLVCLHRRYTIAMLDVDYFKKVNDRYGHDVGDQVLQLVAQHLKTLKGGGKAARYGGEEFAIIYPGKTKHQCLGHLEQLRREISERGFHIRSSKRLQKHRHRSKKNGQTLSVTVSIGVCDRSARENSVAAVMKGADQALYRAKKAGRNRVMGKRS